MHRSTDLNRALTANGRQRNGVSEYLQHLAAGAFLAGLLAGGAVQAHVTDPQPGGAPAVSETPPVPAQTAAGAADPAKVGGQRHRLTPEELHTAMLEAEKRRAAAMHRDPGVPKELAETWGVEVIRIDYSAGGYWLDFRFKVTDAKKALPLFDGRIQPYVDSDKGGPKLGVPIAAKVGALRSTNRGGNVKPGKIYSIIFSNPGTRVKRGDNIAVVIGDFKVEHLTVN